MPDKSFEQAVSAELEGLQIKPDAKVWEAVAASLNREKKRRILVWLLLVGVSVVGATYFWYHHTAYSSLPVLITKKTTKNKPGPIVQKQRIAPATVHKPTNVLNTAEQKIVEQKFEVPKSKENIPHKQTALIPFTHIVTPKDEIAETKKTNRESAPLLEKQFIVTRQDSSVILPETKQFIIESDSEIKRNDSVIVSRELIQNEHIQKEEAEVQKNTAAILTKKKKWQWKLLVEAGVGGFRNSLSLNKSSHIRFQPLSNNSPAFPISGTLYNAQQDAAAARDAFSWSVQVQASKPISKRNKIGLSAGYGLYRTKTGVNQLVNQVHLLETGVEISRNIFLFKSISLRPRLGTGLDLLIASRGFRPTDSSGRLGPKPSFTSLQPHVSAGFELGLGKEPIVYIGPQFKYYIRGLYTLYGEPQHLVFGALRATFPLHQKSKIK